MSAKLLDRPVIWFNFYSNEAPSVRYRGTYFLEELRRSHGISYRHYIPEKNLRSLLRLLGLTARLLLGKTSHTVVIQRVSSFGLYAGLLKLVIRFRRKKHVFLYDLDDAIYEEMDDDRQIRWFMRNVHTVITGSEELSVYARKQNREVRLVTTPVVPTDLRFRQNGSDKLVLGFIGCYWGTHFRNMQELVMPVLKQLEFPVVLEIIGARHEQERERTRDFFRDSNVAVRFLEIDDWNDENEINRAMMGWHLGLAPLRDTVVCRAKSAFKVKQYLNLGIPCVSTEVGENVRFVEHGKNGFLFANETELKAALEKVYGLSPQEREQLSDRALASSAAFQLPVITAYWVSVLAHR